MDLGLKPIQEAHSIKEAGITFFLSTPIPSPAQFKELLSGSLADFQKFEVFNEVNLEIQAAGGGIAIQKPTQNRDTGFRMIRNSGGDTEFVAQGMNEQNRIFFSFHSLKYDKWQSFFDKTLKYLKAFADFRPGLQVKAISLHYIDEFQWNAAICKLDTVFSLEAGVLPPDFLKSLNGRLSFLLEKQMASNLYNDRLDIAVSARTGRININNNLSHQLKATYDLASVGQNKVLTDILNFFHDGNKANLKNVLSANSLKLIGL